ncbi:hypothetical protein BJ684DRAFT_21272 [Piptocephalis cylindrospora]|uniref:HbrB-like-domain-containing protein n=1 Tax=Piptocephalis cylindrospora TaxID=1907219 RepID=A0A4P9Y0A2_9FUNG|nr:hypothetical protein BJ684DRAFT_21272 [Piptocephalis cylindrospora]|eukprot:RKP12165.1 hypothetical protein BJ684DRAFT_21272 [Piptocephalis cylindrospora]
MPPVAPTTDTRLDPEVIKGKTPTRRVTNHIASLFPPLSQRGKSRSKSTTHSSNHSRNFSGDLGRGEGRRPGTPGSPSSHISRSSSTSRALAGDHYHSVSTSALPQYSPKGSASPLNGMPMARYPSSGTGDSIFPSTHDSNRSGWNSVCDQVLAVFTQADAYPNMVEVRVEGVTDLVRRAIFLTKDISLLQQDAAALIATGTQMLLPQPLHPSEFWDLVCLEDLLYRWQHLHTRVIPFLEAAFLPLRLAHQGTPWLEGLSRRTWLPSELALACWREVAIWPLLQPIQHATRQMDPTDPTGQALLLLTAQMLGRVCNAQKAVSSDRRRRLLDVWQEVAHRAR